MSVAPVPILVRQSRPSKSASSPWKTDALAKPNPREYITALLLNKWLQSQLNFYVRYMAGSENPLTPALHIGRTVHAALQMWNLFRWRGGDYDPDAVWPRFCQDWDEDQTGHDIHWDDDEESVKAHTWSMVKAYLERMPIPAGTDSASRGMPEPVGVMDLVRAGGIIVDFKTAASTPGARQVTLTTGILLNCSALLYREATGTRESCFELHLLVKHMTPKNVVTEIRHMNVREEQRMFRILENYVRGVLAGDSIYGSQC